MIPSITASPSSPIYSATNAPAVSSNPKDSQVQEVALPIISSLGTQTRVDGDRAYAICYAGCTAAVAAATLTPAGLVICFEGCLPLAAIIPLSS